MHRRFLRSAYEYTLKDVNFGLVFVFPVGRYRSFILFVLFGIFQCFSLTHNILGKQNSDPNA